MAKNNYFKDMQVTFESEARQKFLADAAKVLKDLGRNYKYLTEDTDIDGKVYEVHLYYDFSKEVKLINEERK